MADQHAAFLDSTGCGNHHSISVDHHGVLAQAQGNLFYRVRPNRHGRSLMAFSSFRRKLWRRRRRIGNCVLKLQRLPFRDWMLMESQWWMTRCISRGGQRSLLVGRCLRPVGLGMLLWGYVSLLSNEGGGFPGLDWWDKTALYPIVMVVLNLVITIADIRISTASGIYSQRDYNLCKRLPAPTLVNLD